MGSPVENDELGQNLPMYLHRDQPPSPKFRQMLGILGGMLLGAAASNIFSMTTANDFSRLPVIVTVAASAIGAFLIALEFPLWTELGSRRGHDHTPARLTRRAGPKARG
jgi:hypothetical protein